MKLTTLADVTVYRMHVPRWAVAPTSGAGAAKYGGRANRPGVEALYLAMKTETAIQEFQQVSTLLPPGTLTSYQLRAVGKIRAKSATSLFPYGSLLFPIADGHFGG